MKPTELKRALFTAAEAARAAGQLMRRNLHAAKKVHLATQHDIKLDLDVRCQKRIEGILAIAFPQVALLGEEGVTGETNAPYRWVVDPIDGTVNFTYGLPHACVSIALQSRPGKGPQRSLNAPARTRGGGYESVVGVVYDPFGDEMWTAIRGQPARLNGRIIHVSQRRKLNEAIVALGFAKYEDTLARMLPVFNRLVHRVRKIRILGAAALSLTYVATGRMDAYKEYGVRLWDIAAGGLIVECAGGEFWHREVEGEHTYEIVANNGRLRRQIQTCG